MLKRISLATVLSMGMALWATDMVKPMDEFVVSSHFGYREPVMGGMEHGLKLHRGLDLVGPANSEIKAIKAGVVVEHWPAPNGYFKGHPVYGGMVVIDHGDGQLSLYAHMKETLVVEGQRVSAGEVLGIQGSTGLSTGDHLHFEILMDPMSYFETPE